MHGQQLGGRKVGFTFDSRFLCPHSVAPVSKTFDTVSVFRIRFYKNSNFHFGQSRIG